MQSDAIPYTQCCKPAKGPGGELRAPVDTLHTVGMQWICSGSMMRMVYSMTVLTLITRPAGVVIRSQEPETKSIGEIILGQVQTSRSFPAGRVGPINA